MAGTGPGDLFDLAEVFLEVCVEALDTIPAWNPDMAGAPERHFVSPSTPVNDCCEQLAVLVNPITARNQQAGGKAHINVPMFVAVATRCVPVGYGEEDDYVAPSADSLTAASRQIYADGWALWNHVHNRIRDKTLIPGCSVVEFVSMQQLAGGGDCAGWALTVALSLDGYEASED